MPVYICRVAKDSHACIYVSILTLLIQSGTSKMKNVTTPTSPTHPLLTSRVSEQSLFRSEIFLIKYQSFDCFNFSAKLRNTCFLFEVYSRICE